MMWAARGISPKNRLPTLAVLAILTVLFIALLITGLPAGARPGTAPSIVGGTPVTIQAAPWHVFVTDGRGGRCGGSLISDQWVLTAAHCVAGVPARSVRLVIGQTRISDAQLRGGIAVDRVVIHPDWQPKEAIADIALLRLIRPTTSTPRVAAITLPRNVDARAWPSAGQPAWIVGWGSTVRNGPGVEQLQRAGVEVLAGPGEPRCGSYGASFVPDSHLCAGSRKGGADACTGDSGGGLATRLSGRWVIIGVSSAGNGCGRAAYPGVYARVTTYTPWIDSQTRRA